MNATSRSIERRNPAQARGDIQSGHTGDKTPGFDPAAAPMETDAEAGGTPLSAEEMALARSASAARPRSQNKNATSHAPAMREFYKPERRGERTLALAIVCTTGVLALVVLAAGLLLA